MENIVSVGPLMLSRDRNSEIFGNVSAILLSGSIKKASASTIQTIIITKCDPSEFTRTVWPRRKKGEESFTVGETPKKCALYEFRRCVQVQNSRLRVPFNGENRRGLPATS